MQMAGHFPKLKGISVSASDQTLCLESYRQAITESFHKGYICQMISLGFFQLGLSSKRWQSEKASVSVWKRGFNLVLHSLPHSAQACTKVFATLGFNCRSPLHHARVCIVLLVYHVPSTLSDLTKIISLFLQITEYTMWSSFPKNNLALKMMCYQSLYFFNP